MKKRNDTGIEDLVRLSKARNEQAWRELISRLTRPILRTCRRMRLSQEESLDVYGQVCFILLNKISEIKEPAGIFGYVEMITRREVLARDKRRRIFEKIEIEAVEREPGSPPPTPLDELEESELREYLMRAISMLPRHEAELIEALFLEEGQPSYKDIAVRLKIPASSIGPTRERILTKLMRILKRLGYKFLVF